MRKFLLVTLLTCCSLFIIAQERENPVDAYERSRQKTLARYEDNRNKSFDEYNAFRRATNEEYTKNMREAWAKFTAEAPEEIENFIEPPEAPECTESFLSDLAESFNCLADKIGKIIAPVRQPLPFEPLPKALLPAAKTRQAQVTKGPIATDEPFYFDFYGTKCSVRLNSTQKFTLSSIRESSVASTWKELSKEAYDNLINDCMWLRDSLQLCGWGYYSLLKKMSDNFLGTGSDESTLMCTYLLMQSGYKVRIGRSNEHLLMLMPSDYKIFSRKSTTLSDGIKYYIFGELRTGDTFSVYTNPFPHEEVISLRIDNLPLLAKADEKPRIFTSYRYPDISVRIAPNSNLIKFFNEYPVNDNWALYSLTSLSKEIKDVLYPKLRRHIQGKSQQEAANILIDFVQTAFAYKTDGEQFGYERPLFGDETFFYPYSDCEDRAILFSILVRDLLNLDVVFIHYPQRHLSTAVRFKSEVPGGGYVMYEGNKYTICDPTYIHARIGMVHSSYRNSTLRIVPIN